MSLTVIELRVGGLTRLSTCDWPGQLAATVFCQGCAWDCPYCHNPGLRPMQGDAPVAWTSILTFLSRRRGLLDAVVFSGGEPMLQPALSEAVADMRQLGFRVGLHTAGLNPAAFAQLLPSLDWVGFDVKAPLVAYPRITGVAHSGERAFDSLRHLLASGVAYEVRTTWHPALLSLDDMLVLKKELLALGVTGYAVQRFRSLGVRPDRLPPSSPSISLPPDFSEGFLHFELR